MIKYILSAGLVLLACACSSTIPTSAYSETGAICDNAGLESQMVKIKDQSYQTASALGGWNDTGAAFVGRAYNQADVERAYQLRDKLRRFDAEVDVQFRTLTSSCKAYSRCMEMRRYREGECRSSMERWRQAEREFSSLTRELREIDAEVEKFRILASQRRDKKKDRPTLNTKEHCDCTNSVGGVFANCCYNDRNR